MSVFRHHGGLQLTMPFVAEGGKLQISQYLTLFKILLSSVLKIFQGEQLQCMDAGREVVPQLVDEFIAYAYNRDPFKSHRYSRETKPLRKCGFSCQMIQILV